MAFGFWGGRLSDLASESSGLGLGQRSFITFTMKVRQEKSIPSRSALCSINCRIYKGSNQWLLQQYTYPDDDIPSCQAPNL